MKHLEQDVLILRQLCESAGIAVSDTLISDLIAYLDELLLVNQTINLTRITERDVAIRLHVLDSLTALPEVLAAPSGPLCDIGTGGGFPGLPLAAGSSRAATLLDSVGKKALAVEGVLRSGSWNPDIHAVGARAEQHAREFPSSYAVVSARAVAPLASLVELASPLLRIEGVLVALKGALTADELAGGDRSAAKVGMQRVSARRFTLPGGDEQRAVVVYAKTAKPRVSLPRREGLAQHSPLG